MRTLCCLLLTVGTVTAQTAVKPDERPLPQWLTGIIAVSGFLFLVFVTMLVKKAWCEGQSRKETTVELESVRENDYVVTNEHTYETTADVDRSKENAYDSVVIVEADDKVTSM